MIEAGQLPAITPGGRDVASSPLLLLPWYLKPVSVAAFLLVALLINAALVLVVLPHAVGMDYNSRFGDLYDLIATNVAQGRGYRVDAGMGETMLREPGYPLLVA